MIKKYKIIIFVCIVAIFCNIAAKISIIDEQNKKVSIFQKVLAAARSGSYLTPAVPVQQVFTEQDDIKKIIHKIPEEFSLTEYAAGIRELIDENHLLIKKSLIFTPEKTKNSNLLKYNTKVVVTGDYIQIKKLISDILSLPGLVYLNSARLVREKEDQGKVKFDFKLSVFFKRGTA